jgi:HD-like signal output (HDOD) protein
MFKNLVKRLFNSTKKVDKNEGYFYYENSKNDVVKRAEQPTTRLAQTQTQSQTERLNAAGNVNPNQPVHFPTAEEAHQKQFYDFLFGETQTNQQYDEISLFVSEQIEKLLNNPKSILQSLPVLPLSLSQILEQLNDDEFDTDLLLELIQQEAVIAGKVIELANSAFYNRTNKEIKDLKTAFMLLGANGLMEGVINGFVSKLAPQTPIYFKQYGSKIWQHSLSTGVIAKSLINQSAHKSDSAQGYLIGLICNLGDMVIYQLLIDSFSFVHPDCQPNSYAFKDLMYKNSKKITYHIAKHWNFPNSILNALAIQTKLVRSSMLSANFGKHAIPCYVYEANILSELEMMFDNKIIDHNELRKIQEKLLFSIEANVYIDKLLERDDNHEPAVNSSF